MTRVAEPRRALGATFLVALLVLLLVVGLQWSLHEAPVPPRAVVEPAATRAGLELSPRALPCRVGDPFDPVGIAIDGVTAGSPVVGLPRDGSNVPGVPPLTSSGKGEFAWDEPPGIRPGSRRGNVLLNAHTWPDGSALGNALLRELDEGETIVVRGARGQRLCYRVSERIEVLASAGFPRYYQDTGKPQLALLVCSGRRLGPGSWTHRTIWFARPVAG